MACTPDGLPRRKATAERRLVNGGGERGVLVLVVGPSGADKDTLLGLAQRALGNDPGFRFVRRAITRPAQTGGEDHEAVSDAEFSRRDFALHWQTHGLRYVIPPDIEADLANRIVVVANVSRNVIKAAALRFAVHVVVITAPPAVLAACLIARERETTADRASRLARHVALPDGISVDTIINDTTPPAAAAGLIAILRQRQQIATSD